MPNAARLVAALGLMATALVASEMIKPLMPESTSFGHFNLINVIIGALCGWFVMGKRAGRGITAAINNGFTGMVSLVFWGLFVQGVNEMVRLATRNRYDNAFESIIAIFEIMAEYGTILLNLPLIILLVIGGITTGLLTEYSGRKWR